MKIFEEDKNFSNVENEIIKKINQDPTSFLNMDLISYSKKINCSKSAISRLVKLLGFSSLVNMKLHVNKKYIIDELFFNINENESTIKRINNIKSYNNYSINNTLDNIKIDDLINIVKKILSSKRIHIFGVGSSYLACYELTHNLLKIGLSVSSSSDIHNSMLILANMNEQDTLIVFSKSGTTKEMLFLKNNLKSFKFSIIVITTNEEFAKDFKYKLIHKDIEKKDRPIATSSKICQLILADIIFYEIFYKKTSNKEITDRSDSILSKWKEFK